MHNPGPPSKPRRILVCDGEQRTALAVVRSLGARGHRVAVCSHESPCLAGKSRHAARTFVVPNARLNPRAYLSAIRLASTAWAADIVLPVTDAANLALLGNRAAVAPAIVPGPSIDAFVAISEKRLLLERARCLGIPTPEQIVVDTQQADDPQLDSLPGPFVVKSSNVLQAGQRNPVRYAGDNAELRKKLQSAPTDAFPLLVQRRIVGSGIGVFLLMSDGKCMAQFAHERIREQPPSGGASVYCRSAAVPPELIDTAIGLLKAHEWNGVAMVEFKRERTTGIHYLMEVNGRLWGSLQLAIDAGVDFPAMIVDLASGLTPRPVTEYPAGIALRTLWGDVLNTLARLRYSPEQLDMPPGSPGRLAALREFLTRSPHERIEIARWSDPMPFVFESMRRVKARFH